MAAEARSRVPSQGKKAATKSDDNRRMRSEISKDGGGVSFLSLANLFLGATIAVVVGVKYAFYIRELHENDMWFSNIGQVEREISFRTESGLYFSYYKQMVLAPSISQGFYELTHDNKTEHLRTINILNRFNIHQELVLGALYKVLPIKDSVEYVYFYINTIFGLHAMYVMALFAGAWTLSDSWLAGLLASCFFILNKSDTTRIAYTIPLRESFGFPFLFAQLALLTYYMKTNISTTAQKLCVLGIAATTFFFTLVWQFAQFILLLESMAFFGVHALGFVPKHKIRNLYLIVIGSLLSVCLLQFVNDMILCSLALSFAAAALLLMAFQTDRPSKGNVFVKLAKLLLNTVAVLGLMVGMSFLIKYLANVESDEHIFKFVKSKLGYSLKRDFDSLLYLCEVAFQMLPTDTYGRVTRGLVFPCYVASVVVLLLMLAYTVLKNWSASDTDEKPQELALNSRPELVYQIIQTVFFGIMAVSTLRFKYLWTPHMCLVGAGAFCCQGFWRAVLVKFGITQSVTKVLGHAVPVVLLSILLSSHLPEALNELKDLREFHDPDTVELMNWIKEKTPVDSSFTGSMQLLAGVKLCTDRPITNHPHYENKFLRERTKQVYQIYARRTPADVHKILKAHGTNYIILENSICYSRGDIGCKLTDILDLDNGHEIEGGDASDELRPSDVPRFCDDIKRNRATFAPYFKKVFENRTFYVYKVL